MPDLKHMQSLASQIVEYLGPYTDYISVCGSIRRQVQQPNDIEIVANTTPALLERLDKMVSHHLIRKAMFGTSERWGKRYRAAVFQEQRVDIFLCDKKNRGYIEWLRTGPRQANQYVMNVLIDRSPDFGFDEGYAVHCQQWAILTPGSKGKRRRSPIGAKATLTIPDEIALHQLLGVPYIAAQKRTAEMYAYHLNKPSHHFSDPLNFLVPELRQGTLF